MTNGSNSRDIGATISDLVDDTPDGVAASVAVVGFDLAVYIASRYAPEYLRLLDAGPVVIGMFGSLVLALAIAYPHFGPSPTGCGRSETRLVVGVLATLGLVFWLIAPQAAAVGGLPAWGWVFLGLLPVELWRSLGRHGSFPASAWLNEYLPKTGVGDRSRRWIALLAVLAATVGVLAAISPPVTALQVLLALTAGGGLTATILQYEFDESDRMIGADHPNECGRTTVDTTRSPDRSIPAAVRSLSARRLLVGDALVEFATAMVSVFFIITVTSVLEVDVTLLGLRLRPDAFFGVLLAVETVVVLVGTKVVARIARRVGRKRVLVGAFAIVAVFPLALINAPSNPVVVGVLFAMLGCFRAARPIRRAVIDSTGAEGSDGAAAAETATSYRLMRGIGVVPGPLIGGLLYAISPGIAFGLATVVGVVGVREVLYDARQTDADLGGIGSD